VTLTRNNSGVWHSEVLVLVDGMSLEILFKVVVAIGLIVLVQFSIVPQQLQEFGVLVDIGHVLAVRSEVVRRVLLELVRYQLLPVVLRVH